MESTLLVVLAFVVAIEVNDNNTQTQTLRYFVSVLPIVAGAATALLLTVALTIAVVCLRKQQKKRPQESPETVIPTSPVSSSTPRQQRHTQPDDITRLAGGGTFPRGSAVGESPCHGTDLTLPYHRIQCPYNHHTLVTADFAKNYVPDSSLSHFRPLVGNYEHTHSSSPSTVQSEVSVTDSEFHTIRECLGDFKNNNVASPAVGSQLPPHPPLVPHPPLHHSNTLTHTPSHPPTHAQQHNTFSNRPTSAPFTRTLWTADGRPYEAVTCPHGIDHVYQPLEHIYEEPHIWMRPLPDPQS